MFERLGIMYLSAALKKDGHQTRLAYANGLGPQKLDDLMADYQPAVVAYSAMTGEHHDALKHIRRLKKAHEFISVFGGPHATFFPDLIHEEGVDAVCIGEGDYAVPDFCRRIERDEPYWKTENFRVKHDGEVHTNPLRDLVADLDELPDPDRDLMYDADEKLRQAGPKLFSVSRGCPYKCTYCFNHQYNSMYKGKGKIVRHRSPERVVAEIKTVKQNFPITYTYFSDDTFLIKPPGWVETFCKLYEQEVGIPFGCSVRANVVTEEVAMLAEAGLWGAWMGIECANDQAANEVFHRDMNKDLLLRAGRMLQKHGIKICAQNIVGLPVENAFEVDKETLDFNIKFKPEHPLASILYPYPGTWIESYSREHGYLKDDAETLETNKRKSMLTFSSKLEKRRIENLHKLFAIFVWMPALRKHCDAICSLPLGWLYRMLFYISYGYGFKFKMSPRQSLSFRKDILNYMGLFFRMVRKT
jgi:radical SAM superfamily enzyme YgiQ (UPF0313 family)